MSDPTSPAGSSDFPARVVDGIRVVLRYEEDRDRVFRENLQFSVRNHPARTALLRYIILAAVEEKKLTVADCARLCEPYGSRSFIREHIRFLERQGCVILQRAPKQRDASILPTKRLAEFYSSAILDIMSGLRDLYSTFTRGVGGR